MARAVTTQHKTIATAAAWIVALLIFFPILYTIITSFKSEQEAIQGFSLIPSGTLESYSEVQAQSGYFKFFLNSVILSVGSTILALIIAVPTPVNATYDPDLARVRDATARINTLFGCVSKASSCPSVIVRASSSTPPQLTTHRPYPTPLTPTSANMSCMR